MAATPETGFLVIADLTGYTAYLSRSELEHAPAITTIASSCSSTELCFSKRRVDKASGFRPCSLN